MGSSAALSRARSRVRQISLGALLLTVVMLGTCSATGVVNARGIGAQLIWRDPASYLSTITLLAGPLLLLLAFSALLTIGTFGRRRGLLLAIAISIAGAVAPITAVVAMAASYSRLCGAGSPTPAQDASCAGGTGALAAVFGMAILFALPFALTLRRDRR